MMETTTASKKEMIATMMFTLSTGQLPKNLNLIPPYYQAYNRNDGLFMVVYMLNEIEEPKVRKIIESKKIADCIESAKSSMMQSKTIKALSNSIICSPITLDMIDDPNYVGIILSNERIVPEGNFN